MVSLFRIYYRYVQIVGEIERDGSVGGVAETQVAEESGDRVQAHDQSHGAVEHTARARREEPLRVTHRVLDRQDLCVGQRRKRLILGNKWVRGVTHGADALHGEQDGGEEQRHVADGCDPRAGRDVGQRFGYGQRRLAGEQAGAGHHPRHGAPQSNQYEPGGYGRERHQQPERADDTEWHQRHGQAEDPSTDREVVFQRRVRIGHL